MAQTSAIEWTEATWNPIVGCSIVSPGCTHCYAMAMAARIDRMTLQSHYEGLTHKINGHQVWTGKIAHAGSHAFLAPLRRRKPTTYFVNSMGDEDVPDAWIDQVFAIMALCPQHAFQVLTKRAARMRDYCSTIQKHGRWLQMEDIALQLGYEPRGAHDHGFDWISNKQFLPNVWLGVSAERQQEADERIPLLLQTPAAVRFLSAEPLLGPIDLTRIRVQLAGDSWMTRSALHAKDSLNLGQEEHRLDWVICGGESGPNARPMHPDWARSLRDQCQAAGVPYFFKQWGEWLGCESTGNNEPPGIPKNTYRRCDDGSFCWPSIRDSYSFDHPTDKWSGHFAAKRVGKKAAGRLLDGVAHNAMPSLARGG